MTTSAKLWLAALGVTALAASAGCVGPYAGVAATGDRVVIAQQDTGSGSYRRVYVCKITDKGLTNCGPKFP